MASENVIEGLKFRLKGEEIRKLLDEGHAVTKAKAALARKVAVDQGFNLVEDDLTAMLYAIQITSRSIGAQDVYVLTIEELRFLSNIATGGMVRVPASNQEVIKGEFSA